jgi:hypothetical protein
MMKHKEVKTVVLMKDTWELEKNSQLVVVQLWLEPKTLDICLELVIKMKHEME